MRKPCRAIGASLVAPLLVVLLSGCGNTARPATPTVTAPAPSASAPASSNPEVVGDSPAPARPRKPFSIHSSCPNVVTIVFGDDPKAQGAGRRTLASNSSIDGPRDAAGKQTVSLLDDKGEPIATVHINLGMKQLEIGRSCATLNAN